MNRAKYIFRIVVFLVAVVLLVYLNGKTDDNTETIVGFKLKMYEKMRTDSLDSKHKLELLVNETTKFVDDSSRVRRGIRYLTGLFALLVVVEAGFLILRKRN